MASSRAVSYGHNYVTVSKYASPGGGRGFWAPTLEPDMRRSDADDFGCFIANVCLSFPIPRRHWVGVGAVVALSVSAFLYISFHLGRAPCRVEERTEEVGMHAASCFSCVWVPYIPGGPTS